MPTIVTLKAPPIQYHVMDERINGDDLSGDWISLILMEGGGIILRTDNIAAIRQVTKDQYADIMTKRKEMENKILSRPS